MDANIEIGKLFNRANADSAIFYFRKVQRASEKNNLVAYKAKAYNSIAASYIIKGSLDSSEFYFNRAEKLLGTVKDAKIKYDYYGDRGILFYYQGNLEGAKNSFQQALELAKIENDLPAIIKYSNNTALALSQLGKNEAAIDIYYDVLKVAEKEKDTEQVGKILNNIGLIYENMEQYPEALSFYEKAFAAKKRKGTQIDIVNAYYNIANTQLLLGTQENDTLMLAKAKENFTKTYSHAKENEYGNGKIYGLEGLGSIAINEKEFEKAKAYYNEMATLSETLNSLPTLGLAYLNLGKIAMLEEDSNSAQKYLLDSKEIIEKTGTLKNKSSLYENLSLLYYQKKDFEKAHQYLSKKEAIESELSSTSLQNKISGYEVKYQTEKKENEILQQRAQIVEKELQVKQKNTIIYGSLGLALLLGLLGYLFYNQQKLKNSQLQKEGELKTALAKIETQNRLQEQRLRISRDLHDNIGAQLTFIISSLDNIKYGFKDIGEKLENKLSSISEFTRQTIFELRDTIWAMNKSNITFEDLQARISNFIDQAKVASEKTHFTFEIATGVDKNHLFTSVEGMNIYRIIQEAVNNALKYSEASEININILESFRSIEGAGGEVVKFEIKIMDNGKGFHLSEIEMGNGLNNMKKRAREIGGELSITSFENKGTTVLLTI